MSVISTKASNISRKDQKYLASKNLWVIDRYFCQESSAWELWYSSNHYLNTFEVVVSKAKGQQLGTSHKRKISLFLFSQNTSLPNITTSLKTKKYFETT
jgi:hypothetical protein